MTSTGPRKRAFDLYAHDITWFANERDFLLIAIYELGLRKIAPSMVDRLTSEKTAFEVAASTNSRSTEAARKNNF